MNKLLFNSTLTIFWVIITDLQLKIFKDAILTEEGGKDVKIDLSTAWDHLCVLKYWGSPLNHPLRNRDQTMI